MAEEIKCKYCGKPMEPFGPPAIEEVGKAGTRKVERTTAFYKCSDSQGCNSILETVEQWGEPMPNGGS